MTALARSAGSWHTMTAAGVLDELESTPRGLATDEVARRLAVASSRLVVRPGQVLATEQRHVDALAARARTLDPVAMLERGWTITRGAGGVILRSSMAVVDGDEIETQFADGRLRSTATARTEEAF